MYWKRFTSGLTSRLMVTGLVCWAVAIPAGIGISFYFNNTMPGELKSRYVMVDDENRDTLTGAFDLQFVSTTAIGDLYRNAGISCAD